MAVFAMAYHEMSVCTWLYVEAAFWMGSPFLMLCWQVAK